MVFGDDHDWKNYPELTNSELDEFGISSPHEQITSDFTAVVVRVHDGDTVTLKCDFRDFTFPLRFSSVDAPELSTGVPGEEARDFLAGLVLNHEVLVQIDPDNRVEKYGRLLGDLIVDGLNVGLTEMFFGYAQPFDRRRESSLPDLNKVLAVKQWF